MKIVTGNPVRGKDFFGRERELDEIWETLASDSVLLAAPRRVGKTSIMHRLADEPRQPFAVLFLDAQDFSGPEDLVTDLTVRVGKLLGDPKRLFKSVIKQVEEFGIWQLRVKFKEGITDRWQDLGQQAIEQALEEHQGLLIIIDELPLLLHKLMTDDPERGKERATELLDWLRHLRHDRSLNWRLRQLLGGSIGLPRIAAYLESSARINDLVAVEIGPLARSGATELTRQLLASRGVSLESPVLETFLDTVETFLPILIQILAASLCRLIKDEKKAPSADLVRRAYEERALGGSFRGTFEDYFERLGRYYRPDEARVAKRLLRELARANGGLSRNALHGFYLEELGLHAAGDLDMLLTWLADDFYLQQGGGGSWSFKSRWLHDWWERYHAGR